MDGAPSPKKVVDGGIPPDGSQRDPVNRRIPPRSRSTTDVTPNAATPAIASPPVASNVRRDIPFRGGMVMTRHRRGSRWNATSGTRTRPEPGVERQHRPRPDRQRLAGRDPQEAARQRTDGEQRDAERQAEAPPPSRDDRPRHRSSQLPGRRREQRAAEQAVQREDPARIRAAGLERQQPGRRDAEDEERKHSVERRETHDVTQSAPRSATGR